MTPQSGSRGDPDAGVLCAYRDWAQATRRTCWGTVAVVAGSVPWSLPDDVVTVLTPPEHADGLAARLGPAALVGPSAEPVESVVALVPTPATEQEWLTLRRQLRGRRSVISLPTPCRDLAASLRIGALALRLLEPQPSEPVVVAERLVDLVLHRDPALTAALAERELAPLPTCATMRDNA